MASAKTLSVGASVALDDDVIPFQKYTSIGRLQLFSSRGLVLLMHFAPASVPQMQRDIEVGAGGHRTIRQLAKSQAISIVYEFAVLF